MNGKRLIINLFQRLVILTLALSCARIEETKSCVSLRLRPACPTVKAGTPAEEHRISDANIFIYNDSGMLEEHIWSLNSEEIPVKLLAGESYSIYAFCNAGFRMSDMTLAQLLDFKYYLNTPDEYSRGIPMSCIKKNVIVEKGKSVTLELERLMSKVSLRINRSRLDKDVGLYVQCVKIGNCPRCVNPFSPSPLTGAEETFASGLGKSDDSCFDLNSDNGNGISDEVFLYLLENPADSLDRVTSPYVELQMDYLSEKWYTDGKNTLKYRFYIRENDSYRIERNCHYKVTVTPHEDGLLCEDSWRVDKSGLSAFDQEEYSMEIIPGGTTVEGIFYPNYYKMRLNSSMHFEIRTVPSQMKVCLRDDLVQDELEDGRAEYVMDSDGKGFTVKSLGRACLSMMEVIPGKPLGENDAQTIVVEIFSDETKSSIRFDGRRHRESALYLPH